MKQVMQSHQESVTVTLSGWARVLFSGTLLLVLSFEGWLVYWNRVRAGLKDFNSYAGAAAEQIRRAPDQSAVSVAERQCSP